MDTNPSTGPEDKYPGPPKGIVLGDIEVGDAILSCFADLHRDNVLILVQGPMEAYVFHRRDSIYMIEDIEMAGVKIGEYFDVFNNALMSLVPGADQASPLPPVDQARESILTEARVKRSQQVN